MALLEKHKIALKEQKQQPRIQKAIKHEDRLRFHTEAYLSPFDIARPATDFLEWVRSLLPKDKYNIFLSLFQFPTPVVDLTSKIYEQLERVFDGKNPASHYRFTSSELREDWEEYREKALNMPEVWRTKGWEVMKTAVNSILVVDVPQEQDSARPEPYFYFLDIDQVIDYEQVDGKIQSILFHQKDETVAIFDDEFYRVVEINAKKEITQVLVENPHSLGYCPAQFFWTDSLVFKEQDLKKNPISPQLANLDWLLFFMISKKHLDLYAPYPIYSGYEASCDFENAENGDYCDGGFLRGTDNNYKILRSGTIDPCPVCSQKNLAGVGSFVEVKTPKTKEDPDLRNPIQITTIDKSSLDYNVEEKERLSKDIENSVVGLSSTVQDKQALNREQVKANYNSATGVLNNLKYNLEKAVKFVDDTVCKLRYEGAFLGSHYSMGTEFYIFTVADLYEQFDKAKKNGANEGELDAISDEIIMTQYRNDPQMMQRMRILRHLEPYAHYTREELIDLKREGLIDEELMKVKINFNNFIDKFERENINLLEFGSQITFDKKISIINETLLSYVRQEKQPD